MFSSISHKNAFNWRWWWIDIWWNLVPTCVNLNVLRIHNNYCWKRIHSAVTNNGTVNSCDLPIICLIWKERCYINWLSYIWRKNSVNNRIQQVLIQGYFKPITGCTSRTIPIKCRWINRYILAACWRGNSNWRLQRSNANSNWAAH